MENVYPKIDALNVEPCRKVIQDAFEQNITHAPGMDVREMVTGPPSSHAGRGDGMYQAVV